MTHTLQVWAGDARVATIAHAGRGDRWSLRYAEAWVADAQSYPLSPALPLVPPAGDYASASIKRFIEHLLPEGRALELAGGQPLVQRRHIIDACQACDLPVAYKYERNLGSAAAVRHIRDGVGFARLFGCAELAGNKAAARLALLRWALFQFLIGNSDAHGKNFSFFVRPGGLLEPTPWYDLVSVLQYDGFDTELAMAYGDVFSHAEVSPFALADFAARCGIDRQLMRREGQRLAKRAVAEAVVQAQAADYQGAEEQAFVQRIATFVVAQAQRLAQLVDQAARWKDEYL